jgi:hypothetical protein
MAEWVCDECREVVKDGAAYVKIVDAKHRGHPDQPTPDLDATGIGDVLPGGGKLIRPEDVPSLMSAIPEARVVFTVVHELCDPAPDKAGYRIPLRRASTLEDWVAWVIHVHEKRWMGRTDLVRMLAFWFSGQRMTLPGP